MVLLRVMLVAVAVLVPADLSQAMNLGQYDYVSNDIKYWIDLLTDDSGTSCCSTADGYRPEAVEWDMASNHYRALVGATWIAVPTTAVIKGQNKIGYALIWLDYDWEKLIVRCFLPGPGS